MKRGRKPRNLKKEKFGRLQPLYDTGERRGKSGSVVWMCLCDCGNSRKVATKELTFGRARSCGCLIIEARTKHAGTGTRLYQIWTDIKTRCFNIKSAKYKWYGKRGITICEEWKNNYSAFRFWAILNGYQDNLTIDKIDNDKGYSPKNCQWLTQSENIKKYWHKDKK